MTVFIHRERNRSAFICKQENQPAVVSAKLGSLYQWHLGYHLCKSAGLLLKVKWWLQHKNVLAHLFSKNSVHVQQGGSGTGKWVSPCTLSSYQGAKILPWNPSTDFSLRLVGYKLVPRQYLDQLLELTFLKTRDDCLISEQIRALIWENKKGNGFMLARNSAFHRRLPLFIYEASWRRSCLCWILNINRSCLEIESGKVERHWELFYMYMEQSEKGQ